MRRARSAAAAMLLCALALSLAAPAHGDDGTTAAPDPTPPPDPGTLTSAASSTATLPADGTGAITDTVVTVPVISSITLVDAPASVVHHHDLVTPEQTLSERVLVAAAHDETVSTWHPAVSATTEVWVPPVTTVTPAVVPGHYAWTTQHVQQGYWWTERIASGYWTQQWVSSGYVDYVYVQSGYWSAPQWVSSGYWNWQYIPAQYGPQQCGYNDYDEYVCWQVLVSGEHWGNVWVDTSGYRSVWVDTGHYEWPWVDTSHYVSTYVDTSTYVQHYVDTSYDQTVAAWVPQSAVSAPTYVPELTWVPDVSCRIWDETDCYDYGYWKDTSYTAYPESATTPGHYRSDTTTVPGYWTTDTVSVPDRYETVTRTVPAVYSDWDEAVPAVTHTETLTYTATVPAPGSTPSSGDDGLVAFAALMGLIAIAGAGKLASKGDAFKETAAVWSAIGETLPDPAAALLAGGSELTDQQVADAIEDPTLALLARNWPADAIQTNEASAIQPPNPVDEPPADPPSDPQPQPTQSPQPSPAPSPEATPTPTPQPGPAPSAAPTTEGPADGNVESSWAPRWSDVLSAAAAIAGEFAGAVVKNTVRVTEVPAATVTSVVARTLQLGALAFTRVAETTFDLPAQTIVEVTRPSALASAAKAILRNPLTGGVLGGAVQALEDTDSGSLTTEQRVTRAAVAAGIGVAAGASLIFLAAAGLPLIAALGASMVVGYALDRKLKPAVFDLLGAGVSEQKPSPETDGPVPSVPTEGTSDTSGAFAAVPSAEALRVIDAYSAAGYANADTQEDVSPALDADPYGSGTIPEYFAPTADYLSVFDAYSAAGYPAGNAPEDVSHLIDGATVGTGPAEPTLALQVNDLLDASIEPQAAEAAPTPLETPPNDSSPVDVTVAVEVPSFEFTIMDSAFAVA